VVISSLLVVMGEIIRLTLSTVKRGQLQQWTSS
jgi:hypothetical protein